MELSATLFTHVASTLSVAAELRTSTMLHPAKSLLRSVSARPKLPTSGPHLDFVRNC